MHRFVFDGQSARPVSAGPDGRAEPDDYAKSLAAAGQPPTSRTPETHYFPLHPASRLSGVVAYPDWAATAAAAKLSTRPNSRTDHPRDASIDAPRHRPTSSESIVPPVQAKPFWEGSTVDGSVFSETASQADSRGTARPPVPSMRTSSQHARPTKQSSIKRDDGEPRGPFMTMRKDEVFDTLRASWPRPHASLPAAAARSASKGGRHDADPDFNMGVDFETSPAEAHQHLGRGRLPHRATKPEVTPFHAAHGETYLHQPRSYWQPQQEMQATFEGDGRSENADDEYDDLLLPSGSDSTGSPTYRQRTLEIPRAYGDGLDELDEAEEERTPKAPLRNSSQVKRTLFTDDGVGAKAAKSRKSREKAARSHVAPERHQPAVEENAGPHDASGKQPGRSKKRQLECDYDDAALAQMSYEDLLEEDFDRDPAQVESQAAQLPRQGSLSGKMEHFISKDKEAQMAFFATMPVKEWDEAGDWLLDRFSHVMQQLRAARQEKRRMVESFENEIAKREADVRSKTENINDTLAGLRSEGGRMVRSRGLE